MPAQPVRGNNPNSKQCRPQKRRDPKEPVPPAPAQHTAKHHPRDDKSPTMEEDMTAATTEYFFFSKLNESSLVKEAQKIDWK